MFKKSISILVAFCLILSGMAFMSAIEGEGQAVLTIGTYDSIGTVDINAATNMINAEGNYYQTNANFRLTSTAGWPMGSSFEVSAWGKSYNNLISQNDWTGVDAGQSYIQYHVQPDSVLQIPLVIQAGTMTAFGGADTAYDKFVIQVSADGATWAALDGANIQHSADTAIANGDNFNMRLYSYKIATDMNYFRIYFPAYSEILTAAAAWNSGQAPASAVMMIPAAAFSNDVWIEPTCQVLTIGSFDAVISPKDVDVSTNMAKSEGKYYKTNANFRLTSTAGWPMGSSFEVAAWNKSYNYLFSQNDWTGVDAGQSYIQYHVQPDSVLQIPLVIQAGTMTALGGADTAYDKFVIQVSADGTTWAALDGANIQHSADTAITNGDNFNMRLYSYKIATDMNYFRIYFPAYSEISAAAASWNSGQAPVSAVMMIPAAAFSNDVWVGESTHQILTVGSFDVVDGTKDVDVSTNMAKSEGKYYKTNANFRLTSTAGWPIGSPFEVAAWNKSYNYLFSQNDWTGVDAGQSYIQYHVQPDSVLQIPLVIQAGTMTALGGADTAYGKFIIQVSTDGATWAALDGTNIQHSADAAITNGDNFNMRLYSYKIATGVNYFRIYFPAYSEIEAAATSWNVGQAPASAVMMIPAAAFSNDVWVGEQTHQILTVGSFDVVDGTKDVDVSTNMAKSEGKYYKTNANFRLTSTTGWPIGSPFEVAAWNKSYNYLFSQNGWTGVDAGQSYIQYHVQPDSVLQIPLVIQADTMAGLGGADAAYGKFVIQVSTDGTTWTALDGTNIQHSTDTVITNGATFNMRLYNYKIATGVNYFRIYFPAYSEIEAAATSWNVGQAPASAVMMIPAASFAASTWIDDGGIIEDTQKVLSVGTFDELDANDVNPSTNMGEWKGEYYEANGYFRLIDFTEWSWPLGTDITIAEWNKTYEYAFSLNDSTGVAEGEAYIQYRVEPGSEVKVPLIFQTDTMANFGGADTAYSNFTIMVSNDGNLWKEINTDNKSHTPDSTLTYVSTFNLRNYTYQIADNVNYLRIYFPNASVIAQNSWNSGQSGISAVMMIPAAAFENSGTAAIEDFENIVVTPTLSLSKLRFVTGTGLDAVYKGATAATSWIGIYKNSELVDSVDCGADAGTKNFDTTSWDSGNYTAILYKDSGTDNILVTVEFVVVDPIIGVEQLPMIPGTFDSVSPSNYGLNDSTGTKNNGDCIIDSNTTTYVKTTGNVKGAPTNNWVFSPYSNVAMWGRIYDYVYTQYSPTGLPSDSVSITYMVDKGTQLQVPIGIPTEVASFFDDFKFETSVDGFNWTSVAAANMSYTEKIIDTGFDPTIRTYAIEIVENGYFRLTWPNQTELESATAYLNSGFLAQGGVFVVPAASFISQYAAAISVIEEQYVVSIEDDILSALQDINNKISIAKLKTYLKYQNSYVKFFDAQGNEITDENTLITSNMIMKAYASGSMYTTDNEIFAQFTLNVTTLDNILVPKITALDKSVVISENDKTITGYYYTDDVLTLKKLLELIKIENGEITLYDKDGIVYDNTGNTVGLETVYLQLTAKGCPNIADGVVIATYEILGVAQKKTIVFESLNKNKVIIDEENKIISIIPGMTIAQFLENIHMEWCSIIMYAAPDGNTMGFVEITDMNTVITNGMSMDLLVPNTTVFYEFKVFNSLGSGENVNTSDSLPLATNIMIILAAGVVIFYRKKKQIYDL